MADSCVVPCAKIRSRRGLWKSTVVVAFAVAVLLMGSAWLDPPAALAQEEDNLLPRVSDEVLVVFEFADFETQVFSELQRITSGVVAGDPPPRRPRAEGRASAVVSRPLTADRDLWDWHQRIIESGRIHERRSGSIVVLDPAGEELARWNFTNGWPSKIEVGTLEAGQSEVLVEEITITFQEITLE